MEPETVAQSKCRALACRDPSHAVQPTDARLMVFESASEATSLWIKGQAFSLSSLCDGLWSAEQLDGCSLVISRYNTPGLLQLTPLRSHACPFSKLPKASSAKHQWQPLVQLASDMCDAGLRLRTTTDFMPPAVGQSEGCTMRVVITTA